MLVAIAKPVDAGEHNVAVRHAGGEGTAWAPSAPSPPWA